MSSSFQSDREIDPTEPLWDLTPAEGWIAVQSELPPAVEALIQTAQARVKSVRCFEFVPSNYTHAWLCLSRLAKLCDSRATSDTWLQETAWGKWAQAQGAASAVRFCEWGSGWGVVAGLASLAGFDASGIELDENLSAASASMMRELGLNTAITCGSYFTTPQIADIYYVYAWPSQRPQVLDQFMQSAPPHALLLLCDGQDRLRVLTRFPS